MFQVRDREESPASTAGSDRLLRLACHDGRAAIPSLSGTAAPFPRAGSSQRPWVGSSPSVPALQVREPQAGGLGFQPESVGNPPGRARPRCVQRRSLGLDFSIVAVSHHKRPQTCAVPAFAADSVGRATPTCAFCGSDVRQDQSCSRYRKHDIQTLRPSVGTSAYRTDVEDAPRPIVGKGASSKVEQSRRRRNFVGCEPSLLSVPFGCPRGLSAFGSAWISVAPFSASGPVHRAPRWICQGALTTPSGLPNVCSSA